jgi:hypothetical protein
LLTIWKQLVICLLILSIWLKNDSIKEKKIQESNENHPQWSVIKNIVIGATIFSPQSLKPISFNQL